MAFQNGLTVSVQFGTTNYCGRQSYDVATISRGFFSEMDTSIHPTGIIESETAEIAIFDKAGNFLSFGHDGMVIGWVNADEVASWISRTANAESLTAMQYELYRSCPDMFSHEDESGDDE